jgi:hypothetical protein
MRDQSGSLNEVMRSCLLKHGIKVAAPKKNAAAIRAAAQGKTVEV